MNSEQVSRWKPKIPYILVLGMAALFLLFSLFREMGVVGTWKLFSTHRQVIDENARLKEENRRLQQEVERLRSNASYIEEIARKELGLIGEKENVIVLDRKSDAPSPATGKKGTGRP